MRNAYITLRNGASDQNLTLALSKGVHNSPHPHENTHYSSNNNISILNGNFSEEEIAWFEEQPWAYIIGDYLPTGRAEQKVYEHGRTFSKPSKPVPPPASDSGFVRKVGNQFMLGDQRFRNSFVNKFNIFTSNMSSTSRQQFFDDCEARGIKLIRTWLHPNYYRALVYPLSPVNLIPDPSFELNDPGWIQGNGFTRSQDTAKDGSWSIKQVSGYNSYDSLSRIVSVDPNKNYIWTVPYTLIHYGGSVNQAPPRLCVGTTERVDAITDAGFLGDATEFTQKQVSFNSGNRTEVKLTVQNWGGRNDAYYDNFHLGLRQSPVLETKESALDNIEDALNEAEERGIYFIFSLADNTPHFNTKKVYVDWANTIYNAGATSSFPYIGFFENEHCKNLYDQSFDILAARFKNHRHIFSWEVGNELRTDRFEGANVNTLQSENLTLLSKPGGWIDQKSSYIKSKDSNHMVGPPACTHRYNWVPGDTVANGTFQGIDDRIVGTLPNIDYIPIHFYPTQGGGEAEVNHKYGQHLGYPDTVNREGLEAMVKDWIAKAKANGKGFMMDEVGQIREVIGSNAIIPLYPRADFVSYIHGLVFNNDGDCVGWWHGENDDGGSYSINISGTWNGNTTNLNFDDRPVAQLISAENIELA